MNHLLARKILDRMPPNSHFFISGKAHESAHAFPY